MADRMGYSVRAAERVLKILKSYRSGNQTAKTYLQIAQETDIPPSTAFKLVNVLVREGFLEEAPGEGEYRIGPEAFRVGNLYLANRQLISVAIPWLERLVDRLGMTVNLGIRSGDAAITIFSIQGTSRLSLTTNTGDRAPLYLSSLGKALLLDFSEDAIADLLPPPPWVRRTEKTIADLDSFVEDLRVSRRRGYTFDDEEGNIGIRCVGYPIRNGSRQIVAAISVTGTTIEMTDEMVPRLAAAVAEAGLKISEELGYDPA